MKPTPTLRLVGGIIALAGLFVTFAQAQTGVTVTITKKAPLETVSASGDVLGVAESTVGTKMTLISATDRQLTLQDGAGTRYVVAASATDYTPPPPAAASVSTPTVQPIPKPPIETPPAAPVIPTPPVPTAAMPAPAEGKQITVPMDERSKDNLVAVWPEGGLAGRPLLVVAHGHGGSGPNEIHGWLELAKTHHFTVVCPTFLSSQGSAGLSDDEPYFRQCLRWIKDNLKYDEDNVYMTGMSGGGGPVWYLATTRPDFFHGFCTQSCNFWGTRFGLDLGKWYNRPIKLIWGSEDLPDIQPENNDAIEALKAADCKNFTTEIVPGGHHQEHPDIVVKWMEEQVAKLPR